MSNITWQALQTADNLTWTPALNSLANNGYSLSSIIDNTALLLTDAIAQLNLGAETTVGSSGTPGVSLYILPSADGTNFADPQTAGAAAANLLADLAPVPVGGNIQIIILRPPKIEPVKFKLLLQNGLGVAFPSASVTFGFYRFGLQD